MVGLPGFSGEAFLKKPKVLKLNRALLWEAMAVPVHCKRRGARCVA